MGKKKLSADRRQEFLKLFILALMFLSFGLSFFFANFNSTSIAIPFTPATFPRPGVTPTIKPGPAPTYTTTTTLICGACQTPGCNYIGDPPVCAPACHPNDPSGGVLISSGVTYTKYGYNPVDINYSCADSMCLSVNTATCTSFGAPFAHRDELITQNSSNSDGTKTVYVTFKNSVGVTHTVSDTIIFDISKPIITSSQSPLPNANKWNKTPVIVSFYASDTTSGIASVSPASVTLSSDGADQTASSTAIDNAGNSNTATVKVSIDKTPPTNPTICYGYSGLNGIPLGANETYSYPQPYFTWNAVNDTLSTVAGYYVYFGENPAGVPSGTLQVGTTYTAPLIPTTSSAKTYYLRVKTEDKAGNPSSAIVTLFTYKYAPIPPTPSITRSATEKDIIITWIPPTTPVDIYKLTGDGTGKYSNTYSATSWSKIATIPSGGTYTDENQVGAGDPERYYKLLVSETDPAAIYSGTTTYFASAPAVGKVNVNAVLNWNLITPTVLNDSLNKTIGTNFINGDEIYRWDSSSAQQLLKSAVFNGTSNSWTPVNAGQWSNLKNGEGFGLNLLNLPSGQTSKTITITGKVSPTNFSSTINKDWNQIGNPFPYSITMNSGSGFLAGKSQAGDELWQWDETIQSLKKVSSFNGITWSPDFTLKPGVGYGYNYMKSAPMTWAVNKQ